MNVVMQALQDGMALIDAQIQADGSMPLELARTTAWHYTNYNASALCRLAELGSQNGVNLWTHVNPSGATLATAIDYTIGGAEQGSSGFVLLPTSPAQIGTFDQFDAFYELHAAAGEAMDAKAAAALPLTPAPQGVDIWPVLPECRVAGVQVLPL
jgi:hypothetical protein